VLADLKTHDHADAHRRNRPQRTRAEHDAGYRDRKESDNEIRTLQLEMLRIQQGLFHSKQRAILAFEGFDSSGKGGAIRALTETLDPRGVRVHPIGAPEPAEQSKHWLCRFWVALPEPGTLAIFDRTWYGRVLVERVDHLAHKRDWKRAYDEINQFEAMLVHDGIDVIKIFLAITKKEQRRRFEERLQNPYKQWKLTDGDLRARAKWSDYVRASDDLLARTDTKLCPWHVVPANDKERMHRRVLEIVTDRLSLHHGWIEREAQSDRKKQIKKALRLLDRDRKG
jgi:polyphosphate kinase 2 (PPK2 family)